MSVKKYNASGKEVTSPIYFINQPELPQCKYIPTSQVSVYHSPEKSLIDFAPSNNFGLKITRDADYTINVNLRFNPKSFFAFATETISSVVLLKKAFSGL